MKPDLSQYLPRKEPHAMLSARLPCTLIAWVRREANARGVSISQIILAALAFARDQTKGDAPCNPKNASLKTK